MPVAGSRDPWRLPVPAFQGPLHADPEAAARAAARIADQVRCCCPRFPCDGPAGPSYWECDRRCKACSLPPWTAPTRTRAFARDGTPEGANNG